MADTNKIGDAALASRVIDAFADADRLTIGECLVLDMALDMKMCKALMGVLNDGVGGEVNVYERDRLEFEGFSREFIAALAGKDGTRALAARAKRLAKSCTGVAEMKGWTGIERYTYVREVLEPGALTPSSLPCVFDLLDDDEGSMRSMVRSGIARMGADGVAPMLKALGDARPMMRYEAATGLKEIVEGAKFGIGDGAARAAKVVEAARAALGPLAAALSDKHDIVREAAAAAIAAIGADPSMVQRLAAALYDPDSIVVKRAAEALGNLGPAARGSLAALAAAVARRDKFSSSVAADAIRLIGFEKEHLPQVACALVPNEEWTWSLLSAVNQMGPDAAAVAEQIANIAIHSNDTVTRRYAVDSLQKLGPYAAAALAPALSRDAERPPVHKLPAALSMFANPFSRRNDFSDSAKALVMIGRDAVPALAGALSDENPAVRIQAAMALTAIGRESFPALPFLEQMSAGDPDPDCKEEAGEAIENILRDVR